MRVNQRPSLGLHSDDDSEMIVSFTEYLNKMANINKWHRPFCNSEQENIKWPSFIETYAIKFGFWNQLQLRGRMWRWLWQIVWRKVWRRWKRHTILRRSYCHWCDSSNSARDNPVCVTYSFNSVTCDAAKHSISVTMSTNDSNCFCVLRWWWFNRYYFLIFLQFVVFTIFWLPDTEKEYLTQFNIWFLGPVFHVEIGNFQTDVIIGI